MGLYSDSKIIYHMAVRPVRGNDHAERMDNFYSGQADAYDSFRKRLLLGRELLWEKLAEAQPLDNLLWCDMGGGTGSNLNFFGANIGELKKVYVVDLATSLLKVAGERMEANGWTNAEAVEADATTFVPDEGKVDVVTFSYSLTMIPDWFAAVDHALEILKPGGRIGVVDFYVSRKHPREDHRRHSWLKRSFWPIWFNSDNVFPSPDHVPYLERRFDEEFFHEGMTRIPYFPNPFFKMPHYVFIGKKR